MLPAVWALILLAAGAAIGASAGIVFARARMMRALSRTAAPEQQPASAEGGDFEGAFVRLVRALPLGVVFVDENARVTFANAAAATIFGFDLDRAVGSHVIASIPNVELERRIDEALRGEASIAPLMLAGSGGKRTYRVSVYPLAAEAEDQTRRVVVFVDDQTDLARLDRARKEFLSNVSHELRTPLSSIKLMLETVIASPDDEAADLFLPQALGQVDRLAELVQQLLDQARAESGQLHLNLRDVDLDAVAQPIVASFEPQASNKGVNLELRSMRPVRVEADPDRLSQVFVNLIDNALRHTPAGGAVIVEVDAQGGDAVLRVRDTGVGIPYRDLPRIFERFYVVDRSRTRMSGGAGLGLAIVKGIIDAHGGTISAESMLGSGTSFTIRIPIMRVGSREP